MNPEDSKFVDDIVDKDASLEDLWRLDEIADKTWQDFHRFSDKLARATFVYAKKLGEENRKLRHRLRQYEPNDETLKDPYSEED